MVLFTLTFLLKAAAVEGFGQKVSSHEIMIVANWLVELPVFSTIVASLSRSLMYVTATLCFCAFCADKDR